MNKKKNFVETVGLRDDEHAEKRIAVQQRLTVSITAHFLYYLQDQNQGEMEKSK